MIGLSRTRNEGLVDRETEVNELITTIAKGSGEVDIIFSKTGLGKSSLVKKLMYRLSERNIPNVILVKTLQLNSCVTSSEWLYIDFIFDAFNKYYEAFSNCSFHYFITSGKCELVNSQTFERNAGYLLNLSSLKQILFAPAFSMAVQSQNLFEFNSYKISADNSMFARAIKADYVKYILENQKVVFIMDNVQNIDSTSLKFLLDWINETKKQDHYFLLQYTITETTDKNALLALNDQIADTGVLTKCIEIEKMSPNYVADIIENQIATKPTSIRFNLDAMHHYETCSNGNLRDLLDYVRNYENEIFENEISSTAQLIVKLSDEAKCILAILVFSGGEIQKDKLFVIWNSYFDGGDLSLIIEELRATNIISDETSDLVLSIAHASIIDTWEKNLHLFSGIDRIVYNRLELICTHTLENADVGTGTSISYYDAWQYLLQIYAKREPHKIKYLLEEFEAGLISDLSATNVWHYIKLFIEYTEDRLAEYKAVYYQMLNICYKLGLFREGMECLKKMEAKFPLKENKLLILHKINFLTGLDRFDKAISLYKWAMGFVSKDDLVWYHLNLCVLCSYRSVNQVQMCKQIGKEISSIKHMQNRSEYAYHLRLMNIYLANNSAVKYAYRSAKWFESHEELYQAGKSYITYSKLLASIGQYRKAIKYSKKAQSLLTGRTEVYHFLYSNLAAFKLLQGECGSDIWQLLCQAELSAPNPYSQLAIIINKLVWCYENRAFDKLDLLMNSAKKLLLVEPDKHIHALYYYNMYLISVSRGNQVESEYYYKKASSLQTHCRFVAARISGVNKHHREIRCRLKKPWHVCFLSYWTYDLPLEDRWITSS